jgi:hypothetical protein
MNGDIGCRRGRLAAVRGHRGHPGTSIVTGPNQLNFEHY